MNIEGVIVRDVPPAKGRKRPGVQRFHGYLIQIEATSGDPYWAKAIVLLDNGKIVFCPLRQFIGMNATTEPMIADGSLELNHAFEWRTSDE